MKKTYLFSQSKKPMSFYYSKHLLPNILSCLKIPRILKYFYCKTKSTFFQFPDWHGRPVRRLQRVPRLGCSAGRGRLGAAIPSLQLAPAAHAHRRPAGRNPRARGRGCLGHAMRLRIQGGESRMSNSNNAFCIKTEF